MSTTCILYVYKNSPNQIPTPSWEWQKKEEIWIPRGRKVGPLRSTEEPSKNCVRVRDADRLVDEAEGKQVGSELAELIPKSSAFRRTRRRLRWWAWRLREQSSEDCGLLCLVTHTNTHSRCHTPPAQTHTPSWAVSFQCHCIFWRIHTGNCK